MPEAALIDSTNPSRRSILAGLAASAVAGAPPQADVDPIIDLILDRRATAALAAMARGDDEIDLYLDRLAICDERLIGTRPRSFSGAVAALELARDEMRDDCRGDEPAHNRLMLALVDGALFVLVERA